MKPSIEALLAIFGVYRLRVVDVNGARLTDPVGAICALILDRGVPPTRKMDDMICCGQRYPDAARTGRKDDYVEAAAAALDEGYAAIKIRAGFGREQDLRLLDAVAARVPDMTRVLVDANMAWDRDEAREMVTAISGYGVGWIEEPLVWMDVEGLRALREHATVPIAGGENAFGQAEGLRLVSARVLDVIMPDIARCGGLISAQAMVSAARANGVPYSPHHYASDIGFLTSLHLCVAEPGALHVLRDTSPWPLRGEVLATQVRVEHGKGWVTDAPGLGVELDEAAIERYRVL